jgi:hypothetical protein
MTSWEDWSESAAATAAWLKEAHDRRSANGKRENEALRLRIADSRAAGQEMHAEVTSLALHKKSIAFTRCQRLRGLAEQEQDLKKVGAASRRSMRDLARVKSAGRAAVFEFEPSNKPNSKLRRERDIYYEWIGRGLTSGSIKNFKKTGKPRSLARQARWHDGEFQDKIAYIERADALEEVAGNVLSNMGDDIAERIGCASRIEELEPLARKNSNVYVHSILALPANLSPEGRAEVLRELCSHYERLRLPYTAALHKPDPNNSQKNFHAHILVSLRPMERANDRWNFAAHKLTWLNTTAGVRLQRRLIARTFNAALAAERSHARYTHRSRMADGLAPGGFTKWGGTRLGPQDTGTLGQFVRDEADALVASTLDEVVRDLVVIADEVETAEDRLSELKSAQERNVRTDALSNADRAAGIEAASAGDVTPGGPVASSQRPAASDGGRERSRDQIPNETTVPDEDVALPEPASVSPSLAFEVDLLRRFADIRTRRASDKSRPITPDDLLAETYWVDHLENLYRHKAIVLTIDDGDLLFSHADEPDCDEWIRDVANSQHGEDLLKEVARDMQDLANHHFGIPDVLASENDDLARVTHFQNSRGGSQR